MAASRSSVRVREDDAARRGCNLQLQTQQRFVVRVQGPFDACKDFLFLFFAEGTVKMSGSVEGKSNHLAVTGRELYSETPSSRAGRGNSKHAEEQQLHRTGHRTPPQASTSSRNPIIRTPESRFHYNDSRFNEKSHQRAANSNAIRSIVD